MVLDYLSKSHTGLVRTVNQDYVGVYQAEDGLIAVICDGVGGKNAGEVASEIAAKELVSHYSTSRIENPGEKMLAAMTAANQKILEYASADPLLYGMATTADLLFITTDRAFWGHIGDSRVYYHSPEAGLIRLTRDHTLTQSYVEKGYMSEFQAERHPDKNVILRALGQSSEIVIDFSYIDLASEGHWRFLLCTDGVTGLITDDEISMILSFDDLNDADSFLKEQIDLRGAPDNYSYIIISNKS